MSYEILFDLEFEGTFTDSVNNLEPINVSGFEIDESHEMFGNGCCKYVPQVNKTIKNQPENITGVTLSNPSDNLDSFTLHYIRFATEYGLSISEDSSGSVRFTIDGDYEITNKFVNSVYVGGVLWEGDIKQVGVGKDYTTLGAAVADANGACVYLIYDDTNESDSITFNYDSYIVGVVPLPLIFHNTNAHRWYPGNGIKIYLENVHVFLGRIIFEPSYSYILKTNKCILQTNQTFETGSYGVICNDANGNVELNYTTLNTVSIHFGWINRNGYSLNKVAHTGETFNDYGSTGSYVLNDIATIGTSGYGHEYGESGLLIELDTTDYSITATVDVSELPYSNASDYIEISTEYDTATLQYTLPEVVINQMKEAGFTTSSFVDIWNLAHEPTPIIERYHLAFSYEKTTGGFNVYFFMNGVLEGYVFISDEEIEYYINQIVATAQSEGEYESWVDGLQILKGAIWTENFTPPSEPFSSKEFNYSITTLTGYSTSSTITARANFTIGFDGECIIGFCYVEDNGVEPTKGDSYVSETGNFFGDFTYSKTFGVGIGKNYLVRAFIEYNGTVYYGNTVSVSTNVIVRLDVSPLTPELQISETIQLEVLATYTNGETVDITNSCSYSSQDVQIFEPIYGQQNKFDTKSSNENTVVSVSSAGLIVALAGGLAKIHIYAPNYLDTKFIYVVVQPAEGTVDIGGLWDGGLAPGYVLLDLSGVYISIDTIMYKDGTQQATLIGEFGMSPPSFFEITSGVVWSSSRTDIATIDSHGLIVGISPGITFIKASYTTEDNTYQTMIMLRVEEREDLFSDEDKYQYIPLSPTPNQSFRITLNARQNKKVELEFFLLWNEESECWFLSLSNPVEQKSYIDSLPLYVGKGLMINLLSMYSYMDIGSCYILDVSNKGTGKPNKNNLGIDFAMVWGYTK